MTYAHCRRVALLALFVPMILVVSISCSTLPIPYQTFGEDLAMADAMEAYRLPMVSVDEPEIYYRGEQWAVRAAELIRSAKHSIATTVFLASWSPQSAIVLEELAAKARSGIPVYLIFDSISYLEYTASSEKMKSLNKLRADGVRMLEFNPFTGERILLLHNLMLREHRKFLIVDSEIVALGGMNYNYVSLNDSSSSEGQRDSMYVFRSHELAKLLIENFVEFWNASTWDEVALDTLLVNRSTVQPEVQHRAWVADQYHTNETVKAMFLALFDAADREILLLPFLPFLDKVMKDSVKRAVDRGVVVKMLVPWDMRTENRLAVEYAALDLLELGIELYREPEPQGDYRYPLLHEKLVVVDDRYVMVGSSNYNYRSMNLSNELSVVVESTSLNRLSREHLNELFIDAHRITVEEARSWRKLEVLPNYWFTFVGG